MNGRLNEWMNGWMDRWQREEDVKRSERHRLAPLQRRLSSGSLNKTLPRGLTCISGQLLKTQSALFGAAAPHWPVVLKKNQTPNFNFKQTQTGMKVWTINKKTASLGTGPIYELVGLALAQSGPSPIQSDFQPAQKSAGPTTAVYLKWGRLYAIERSCAFLSQLWWQHWQQPEQCKYSEKGTWTIKRGVMSLNVFRHF